MLYVLELSDKSSKIDIYVVFFKDKAVENLLILDQA